MASDKIPVLVNISADQVMEFLKERGTLVEVVRCRECKYHLPETERTNPYCNRFHCMKPDDWYCADGERKVQDDKTGV